MFVIVLFIRLKQTFFSSEIFFVFLKVFFTKIFQVLMLGTSHPIYPEKSIYIFKKNLKYFFEKEKKI